MKFAIKYLSQFVDQLPKNLATLTQDLIHLGIEVVSVTSNDFENAVLEVSVAPNRADLLSIIGIARELAFINNAQLKLPIIKNIHNQLDHHNYNQAIKATVLESLACPKYSIRIIRDININALTPDWMQEALKNAGINLISPVVDITNYVMLELGQPLHAFDLHKINQEIIVRTALNTEEIVLLNKNNIKLTDQDLIIADREKPLAIAGIMGGIDSSITTTNTKDIIIECAYFEPVGIRLTSRRHNILSDSSNRFVRNIDPNLQELAIQRCSDLLQEIVGGQFSEIITVVNQQSLPKIVTINLNKDKIKQILGVYPPEQKIIDILQGLGMTTIKNYSGWKVTVPSWRQDINIAEDLIEEIARFIGYNNISKQPISLPLVFKANYHQLNFLKELEYKNCLAARGYSEIISYSFIDLDFAEKFYPVHKFYELKNPISKNMSIMRPGLWPGLLIALIYNYNRQQTRIRLFELGTTFEVDPKTATVTQHKKIAGIISGKLLEENWQNSNKKADFFDLKNDMLALMQLDHNQNIQFVSSHHSGLHPLQSANICLDKNVVGVIGALHPALLEQFSIVDMAFVFELNLELIAKYKLPKFTEISKFPSIRRDFSIVVDSMTHADQIKQAVQDACGELLKKIIFFDLYVGDKLPENKKGLSFAVILQHVEYTLVEQKINETISKILIHLEQIGAYLRT